MLFLPFHHVRARKHFHSDQNVTDVSETRGDLPKAMRAWLLPFFYWLGHMLLPHGMWAPVLQTEDGTVVCLLP